MRNEQEEEEANDEEEAEEVEAEEKPFFAMNISIAE
jgi:hypothetical protein